MPRSRSSYRAVAILVGVTAGLLALGAGGPAAGHAVLLGTDPRDGAVLETPPDEVTITFNEPVQAVDGGTTLLAADGSPVDATTVAVNDTVVVTPDAPLTDGTYVVSWRVISLDSHPVAGAFSFSVGAPSSTSIDAQVAQPSAGLVTARAIDQALVYLGTFLVVGLVVFELLVLHVSPGAAPMLRRRLQRVRAGAVVVAGVALVAAVPLTTAWQAGAGLTAVVDTTTWTTGITSDTAVSGGLGLLGLIVATAIAPRAGRDTRATWPAGLALGASTLALGALLLVGHTRTFGPAWLVLPSDALHVAAGAVWLGGVTGLVLVLAPSAGVDPRRAGTTVARFSELGAWLVLVLALTGVTLGWRTLGTVEALFGTDYGRTLLVKAGLALCVVAIAAWNRYRLVPAVTTGAPGSGAATPAAVARRRLGRTVLAETALLGLVLGATGVLVSNSPVATAPAAEEVAPQGVDVTEEAGSGSLRARITPGRVGVNSLEITLLDSAGAPLEPIETPELSTTLAEPAIGPFTRPLTETGTGTYEATLDLTMPGSWTVTVSVRTSKYENPIVDIPIEVTS